MLIWNPRSVFGYASAQSLVHVCLCDTQGRPSDSGLLVLVDAVPRVLARGILNDDDGGPDKRPTSIKILRQVLALLGLQIICGVHYDDPNETRKYVRVDTSDEGATAFVLVVDVGRPDCAAYTPQYNFGRLDPELIKAVAGTIGMLHGFTRGSIATEGAGRLTSVGWPSV
jgi:hypothetical protein